ncbi:Transposon TX1 uncharacterized 149 kDa protein [Linum perenne]
MALWWVADLPISVVASSDYYVHISINVGSVYYVTFLHAPNDVSERSELWETLSRLNPDPDVPWLLLGDFNAVIAPHEKQGKHPPRNDSTNAFKDFITNNHLLDMGYRGNMFTWSNNQEGEDNVKVRLDRGLCSVAWRTLFDKAVIYHETIIGSDHAPLRLELHESNTQSRAPFRFDERWLQEQDFSDTILNAWMTNANCQDNLKTLHKIIHRWKRQNQINSRHRLLEIQRELKEVQSGVFDEDAATTQRIFLRELNDTWRKEEQFWKQRSRVGWLREGDRNTKFFHASVIQRKLKNSINKLKDENDTWVEDHSQLQNHVTEFFKKLFTKRSDLGDLRADVNLHRVVSDEMNVDLTKPISIEEIKQAAFSLGASKAPGPDGFNGVFFRKFWSSLGNHFCSEIVNFFITGDMPEGWNDTHITLIPKVPNAESISQYRPISCCNFRYKIISKILSSRLKNLIPAIVSELQPAFMGDRAIQDNIIIVHEVLHNFKNRRKSGNWDMMLKMDMRKAYDLVDWNCLDHILSALGFGETWCGWIKACVRTVKILSPYQWKPY